MAQRQQGSAFFRVEVENRFKNAKRELLVYSSYANEYSIVRSPYGKNESGESTEFAFPEGEHLLITVAPMHADEESPGWVELPLIAGTDFDSGSEENGTLKIRSHRGRPRIPIEKGPHTWQLKVTAPPPEDHITQAASRIEDYNVTVGADEVPTKVSGPDDTVRVGDNG